LSKKSTAVSRSTSSNVLFTCIVQSTTDFKPPETQWENRLMSSAIVWWEIVQSKGKSGDDKNGELLTKFML